MRKALFYDAVVPILFPVWVRELGNWLWRTGRFFDALGYRCPVGRTVVMMMIRSFLREKQLGPSVQKLTLHLI